MGERPGEATAREPQRMGETQPVAPFDPRASLNILANAASGSHDDGSLREQIAQALLEAGREADVRFCSPGEIEGAAREAAADAHRRNSAVVAVGGDGTLSTVANAAHRADCAMGIVPQGTFNYFGRTHGVPQDALEAMRLLLASTPQPVQVAAVNDRLFLVNASLGLYPDLLEDREAYKARFGRSRMIAFGAAVMTVLRAQRLLDLQLEHESAPRKLRALTLFVGNNRLQLEQVGVAAPAVDDVARPDGRLAAIVLRPIGIPSMLWLMARGAMGSLGAAQDVDHFEFETMRVRASIGYGRRVKVACDGEVEWQRSPLEFRVLPRPLYLLKPDALPAIAPGNDGTLAG